MKRLLVTGGILAVLAVGGLAQFSGSWEGNLHVLPSLAFDYSTVELIYTVSGWEITSTSKFTDSAFDTQAFEAAGTLGDFAISTRANFDPTTPAYKDAQLTVVYTIFAVTFTGGVHHWVAPYIPEGTCEQTPSSYLEYTFQASAEPITIKTTFVDCCSGTSFHDLTFTITDISLCCDLSFSGELSFSKQNGFEYWKVTVKGLALCPDCVVFDLSVTFTTESKLISITPKLDLPVDPCFTLYADVDFDVDRYLLSGIEVQGFAIRCDLSDCSYFELKTSLTPGDLGFSGEEFEYFKLHVCGPACCGGEYTGEFSLFFATSGGPLGLSRINAQASLPLTEGFSITIKLDLPLGGDPQLDLGWTFSF